MSSNDPREEDNPPPVDDVDDSNEGEDKSSEPKVQTFTFPAHQSHMLSIAKMCQDNRSFADCIIQCDSGVKFRTHRLVLGSASSFLKLVFGEVPQSLSEVSVMVPGVKVTVVRALVDFLYTGEMSVNREDTTDLQLLLDTLRIDPSLITVETSPSSSEMRRNSPQPPKEEGEASTSGGENREKSLKRKNKSDDSEKDDDEDSDDEETVAVSCSKKSK